MWHTADGLTLGTTMVELQKINRKPYDSTLRWDNGGQVRTGTVGAWRATPCWRCGWTRCI